MRPLCNPDPCAEIIDRPTRSFGPLRRFAAAAVYLSDLRPAYHALRPLRFVLDCTLGPVVTYLEELIRDVACQITPLKTESDSANRCQPPEPILECKLSDDGENCLVVDERGQPVSAERLSGLIAGTVADPVMHGVELRQQTFRRMQKSGASIAVDAAGRLWYAAGHAPVPDALRTLTHLLVLLSRNDLAFSEVLDRADGGRMKDEG